MYDFLVGTRHQKVKSSMIDVLQERKYTFENIRMTSITISPAGIYLFKVNNGNTRTMNEICLRLTVGQWRCSRVFTVNFIWTSYTPLMFPMSNLNKQIVAGFVMLLYWLIAGFWSCLPDIKLSTIFNELHDKYLLF